MRSAMASSRPRRRDLPISQRASPTSRAKHRPASSMRVTRPSASNDSMRAPMSMAVCSTTAPCFADGDLRRAAADVDVHHARRLRGSSARRRPSRTPPASLRASPALTDTNLPAWAANRSPMARALRRRTATPVRISAPVSIGVRREAGQRVLPLDERAERVGVDRPSSAYGVSRTSTVNHVSRATRCSDCRDARAGAARTPGARSRSRCRRRRCDSVISSSTSRLRRTLLKKIAPAGVIVTR